MVLRLVDRARRDDYGAFILWLHSPFISVLMVPLLIALFYHMALGLQVVVEDYVHTDRIKIPTVVVIHLASFGLAVAGIVTTLRIGFGGELRRAPSTGRKGLGCLLRECCRWRENVLLPSETTTC